MDRQGPPIWPHCQLTRGLNRTRHKKDDMMSRQEGSTMRHLADAHSVTDPAGSLYRTAFLAVGGKAIVHWIGY